MMTDSKRRHKRNQLLKQLLINNPKPMQVKKDMNLQEEEEEEEEEETEVEEIEDSEEAEEEAEEAEVAEEATPLMVKKEVLLMRREKIEEKLIRILGTTDGKEKLLMEELLINNLELVGEDIITVKRTDMEEVDGETRHMNKELLRIKKLKKELKQLKKSTLEKKRKKLSLKNLKLKNQSRKKSITKHTLN